MGTIQRIWIFTFACMLLMGGETVQAEVRSAHSGLWSDPTTWEGGQSPGQGDDVMIDSGHVVIYDVLSNDEIRLVHVRGKLEFSRTANTQLDVGMIILSTNDHVDVNEDCSQHHHGAPWVDAPKPALEVGTMGEPIPDGVTARIRLVYFPDMDADCAPGIISYGGRMDFHGRPMNASWVKLGATADEGATSVTLAEPMDWRVGDLLIITRSRKPDGMINTIGSFRTNGMAETEERTIVSIAGNIVTLGAPLQYSHPVKGLYAGEVANLSRNVVVESKDPDGIRGHTMYHEGSSGSISYAEFAHLGKENTLARYPIHFHVARTSMRGTSVIGASIWDSKNRFITIHSTDYVVVRNCVGYKSLGHGFFMEDATEVFNFLDGNLAVLAYEATPLPNQALQYDENDGAGFWWANGRNAFLDNVATECDQYGYRFDIRPYIFAPVLQPDGTILSNVQINRLSFVLFKGNEVHATLKYGFTGIGDALQDDPFIMEDLRVWESWYSISANFNNFILKNFDTWNMTYGFHTSDPKNGIFSGFRAVRVANEVMSFRNTPEGLVTLEDVVVDSSGMYPFKIMGQTPRNHDCDIHVRNYSLTNIENGWNGASSSPYATPTPRLTLYLHDWFGADQDAKVIPLVQERYDGLEYEVLQPIFFHDVKVALTSVPFPENPIAMVDNLPPATVILSPAPMQELPATTDEITVTGTCIDASTIVGVMVNGVAATPLTDDFTRWQAMLTDIVEGEYAIEAIATDEFGNVELNPHRLSVIVGDVSTSVAHPPAEIPARSLLAFNYPNPFNPTTTIRYALDKESRVLIKVFNTLGQDIATLVDELQNAGHHAVVWDGKNSAYQPVASGVYIFRMVAADFVSSHSMVLSR